jgi:hypothetical protein
MGQESKTVARSLAKKRAVWQRRIARWEHSGRSQEPFCRERGLPLSTFQWWRARLKRAEPLSAAAAFMPLALQRADVDTVEITLRSNTRVRVEGAGAARLVDALIARFK